MIKDDVYGFVQRQPRPLKNASGLPSNGYRFFFFLSFFGPCGPLPLGITLPREQLKFVQKTGASIAPFTP